MHDSRSDRYPLLEERALYLSRKLRSVDELPRRFKPWRIS